LIAGPDGWMLSPEGAVIHPAESVAVIADVHLGYEWARAAGGDVIPAHSLAETLARLGNLLDQVAFRRLVVAGDLVERPSPCPRTWVDMRRLKQWLDEKGVELIALRGNHDPPSKPPLPLSLAIDGWTIGHGHRPIRGSRTISGHHHPILRASGVAAPCFLVGPGRIVLPAFSPNAAGLNVLGEVPTAWLEPGLRCVAGLGRTVLDFGLLSTLRAGTTGAGRG
jgi:putative SbcD/Mre11-related phosphoesterase